MGGVEGIQIITRKTRVYEVLTRRTLQEGCADLTSWKMSPQGGIDCFYGITDQGVEIGVLTSRWVSSILLSTCRRQLAVSQHRMDCSFFWRGVCARVLSVAAGFFRGPRARRVQS